ncbi:1,4-dihydroxy-2-naphthoate polyprenyltransferase [Propioniferax innocua]|uniref:1,4-dihydroxy-2-naphthoate octaprenyltransferase n=1 Tax=Propioniferax innocua TaxID=1753 RepID=A0A542ZD53_9ACTN|nr:1,4-dihydroxy-2-naphthoate polyprenyltransferase [Propioniferax innocua]TQL58262.1 1,4-dihydroxy-2-naphthoate prenyltransferase [Propioniferax innocua]
MATAADWVEGARLRTLPAAFSPVIAGAGIASFFGGFQLVMSLLALVVSLALQVGVNFANDYSDGIRGTDDAGRVGPMRLVGSGAAPPTTVKRAAFGCFGLAAVAGLVLIALSGHWWLIVVGVLSVVAAWYYTGGTNPYGYLGLGEVFVFVFFGLVAVGGTVYVQLDAVPMPGWWAACAIGFLAAAILVANNLRDIDGDVLVGKRTLATRLGDNGTRMFLTLLMLVASLTVVGVAMTSTIWALLGLVFLPIVTPSMVRVMRGVQGLRLIGVLKAIGIGELACAVGLAVGLILG